MRFCPECGSTLKDHESTCRKCGAVIAAQPQTEVGPKQAQKARSLQGMITAERKRTPFYGRSVLLFLLALLLFASGLMAWRFLIKPGVVYRKAERLFDAGEYKASALLYESVPGYQVSDDMAQLSWYREGLRQMDAGEYMEAFDLFTRLRGIYDSNELAESCFQAAPPEQLYQSTLKLIASGDIETAYSFCRKRLFQISSEETISELYYRIQKDKWKEAVPESRIEFGFYEQDYDQENGPEPIEWIIAEKDGTVLTLVSAYVLDHVNYCPYKAKGVTWENSDMRAFLNDSFFHCAFGPDHRRLIQKTRILPDGVADAVPDAVYPEDYVFIPDSKDAARWFPTPEKRMCGYLYPFDYRKSRCQWWLRETTGTKIQLPYRMEVTVCSCVDEEGNISDYSAYFPLGVRPVIRIDLGKLP